MSEMLNMEAEDLLGTVYDENDVPMYPARIFWNSTDGFFTDFPYAPARFFEVRFREAVATEDGDFTICEVREVDTSAWEEAYGEWKSESEHE